MHFFIKFQYFFSWSKRANPEKYWFSLGKMHIFDISAVFRSKHLIFDFVSRISVLSLIFWVNNTSKIKQKHAGNLISIFDSIWTHSGTILGPFWALLGPSWGHNGASWDHVRAFLGPSWLILGHLGPILSLSWGILNHLGAILVHLGPSWPILGPSCAHFESI